MLNLSFNTSAKSLINGKSEKSDLSKTNFQIKKNQVNVFIAGTGTVGKELENQIKSLTHPTHHLFIAGSCNTRFTKWNHQKVNIGNNFVQPIEETEPTDWSKIIQKLKDYKKFIVFADCTGSADVAGYYKELLESGVHVVTPGKIANTLSQDYFDDLTNNTHRGNYLFEGTVGAGLPILSTIKQLRESGDEITSIEGVASGTLTYIFGALENGLPFSKAVKDALESGYSEPDPRDDLSGEDVARKFLILARISGYKIDRKDIIVENQTPEELRNCNVDVFLDGLKKYDEYWKSLTDEAKKKNEVLRFTGKFSDGNITVGVQRFPKDSPFGSLNGTDNQFIIHTGIYKKSPIIIQGPGAGKEVTAQVVLSDILKIASNS